MTFEVGLPIRSRDYTMYVNANKGETRFPELDYPAIGSRITDCRKRRHLSEKEVADLLSVCHAHYHRLEGGKRGASLEIMNALSDILDVSLDYLIKGEDYHNDTVVMVHTALELLERAHDLLSQVITNNTQ